MSSSTVSPVADEWPTGIIKAQYFVKSDFMNEDVDKSMNPSTFGYHHGPFPDPLEGSWWDQNGNLIRAPQPILSNITVNLCMVHVGNGLMCGIPFALHRGGLRKHMREEHPYVVDHRKRLGPSIDERVAGANTLKKYVRDGGWRNALFQYEPKNLESQILEYATAMTRIAAEDAEFRERYGSRFHRTWLPTGELQRDEWLHY